MSFASQNVRQLLDQWRESLEQVLESMTDQRPKIELLTQAGTQAEVSLAAGAGPELLWWEQPFKGLSEMIVWAAAPRPTWEFIGTLTLKAAGLDTVDTAEARNTWFEILGQSLSALARSTGAIMGQEITCDAGVERSPGPEAGEWATLSLTFGESRLPPLLATFSPKLISAVSAPRQAEAARAEESMPAKAAPHTEPETVPSRTMDLLLDVDLPVSISFGKAQLPMKDVLKLTTGSIVELNRSVNEQVEVLVNQCLIARGEVVVVDGNYGVRIQQIVTAQERLRSLR